RHPVVGGPPVGHQHAIEAPGSLGDIDIEVRVFGEVKAVGQVVGIHDGADVRAFDGGFEDGQVDLAHGAFVDDGVHVVAVVLRIVSHEVLDGGGYAELLHALDIPYGDPPSQERILTEVFKVAAVHRRGINVDARAQHEVNATRAGIGADGCTDALRQRRVPGGRQCDAARHGGGRTVVARTDRPVGHLQLWQSHSGNGADIEEI